MLNAIYIRVGSFGLKAFEYFEGENLAEVYIPVAEVFMVFGIFESEESYHNFTEYFGEFKKLPGNDSIDVITSAEFMDFLKYLADFKHTVASFMLFYVGEDNPLVDNAFKLLKYSGKRINYEKLREECGEWLGEYFQTMYLLAKVFGKLTQKYDHYEHDSIVIDLATDEYRRLQCKACETVTGYTLDEWCSINHLSVEDHFIPMSPHQIKLYRQYIESVEVFDT